MSRDEVIAFIRRNGPVLPVQIAKILNTNTLMASAILSELKSNQLIRLSSVKVGGSPLYYVDGQESKLMNFSDKLHEKEQEAYASLRKNLILRDRQQPPHIRVALRAIKDFSKQIVVKTKEGEEIFWKWFLLGKEDAETKVREMIQGKEESKPEPEPAAQKSQEPPVQEQQVPPQIKPLEVNIQKTAPSINEDSSSDPHEAQRELPAKPVEPRKKETVSKPTSIIESKDDAFIALIQKFFDKKEIDVHKSTIIRKNTEAEFFVAIPSSVGKLTYYCKAKKKQRITDSDLASAYVQGEINKLPVLFITTGDLTKKAKEMLNTQFKNIRITKV